MPSSAASTNVLTLTGMRMWTADSGLSAGPVTITCADKPCPHSGAPNAVISGIAPAPSGHAALISTVGNDEKSTSAEDTTSSITSTTVVGGKHFFVLPGFIDSHVHFFDGGRRKTALNLSQCYSRADVVSAIRRYMRKTMLPPSFSGEEETAAALPTPTEAKGNQPQQHEKPFSRAEIRAFNAWKLKIAAPAGSVEKEGVEGGAQSSSVAVPWVAGFQWNDKQLGAVPNKLWLDEACRGADYKKKKKKNTDNEEEQYDEDETVADVPIVLVRLDCHSCVVNSTALRLSGINAYGPPNPVGGVIDRWVGTPATGAATPMTVDPTASGACTAAANSGGASAEEPSTSSLGEPTGYLRERAMQIVNSVRRISWAVTDADLLGAYDAASAELLANGVTSCFSMTSLDYDNVKEFEFLMKLGEKGNGQGGRKKSDEEKGVASPIRYPAPAVRMRSVVTVEEIDQLRAFKQQYFGANGGDAESATTVPFHNFGTDFFTFGAVKIFSDGSLGSRTAAMLEPYGDIEATETSGEATAAEGEGVVKDNSNGDEGDDACQSCPCGTLLSSCEDLHASIKAVAAARLQCCTHAIGDRACMVIQDAYESCTVKEEGTDFSNIVARRSFAGEALRFRIEHCQHIASLQEIDRYKASGTIPSVQPCHLLFDGDHIASGRLGPKRVALAYAFASMLSRGVRPVFGTDWMVAPLCPISNILAAVHRRPIDFTAAAAALASSAGDTDDNNNNATSPPPSPPLLSEAPVWNEKERISVEAALTAYTADAAHGMFLGDRVGHIRKGYFADFVILDADPLAVLSADEAAGGGRPLAGCTAEGAQRPQRPIRVAATIVGGRVRYVAKGYEHLLLASLPSE